MLNLERLPLFVLSYREEYEKVVNLLSNLQGVSLEEPLYDLGLPIDSYLCGLSLARALLELYPAIVTTLGKRNFSIMFYPCSEMAVFLLEDPELGNLRVTIKPVYYAYVRLLADFVLNRNKRGYYAILEHKPSASLRERFMRHVEELLQKYRHVLKVDKPLEELIPSNFLYLIYEGTFSVAAPLVEVYHAEVQEKAKKILEEEILSRGQSIIDLLKTIIETADRILRSYLQELVASAQR